MGCLETIADLDGSSPENQCLSCLDRSAAATWSVSRRIYEAHLSRKTDQVFPTGSLGTASADREYSTEITRKSGQMQKEKSKGLARTAGGVSSPLAGQSAEARHK